MHFGEPVDDDRFVSLIRLAYDRGRQAVQADSVHEFRDSGFRRAAHLKHDRREAAACQERAAICVS